MRQLLLNRILSYRSLHHDSPNNRASLILGNQNSNIPRIIEIFAEAFSVEALPPSNEVYGRMVNITRQVQVCD